MTDGGGSEVLGPAARAASASDEAMMRAALGEAGPAVRRYLFTMGADWDQAEDMTQEALLKAWRKRASFDGRASVRTWIFSVARNHWLDQIRRRRHIRQQATSSSQELVIDPRPTPPTVAQRAEFAAAVQRAVQTLPSEQREALALRESEGLTFRQIGELLDVPLETAKSRVRYALLKLADQLEVFAPEGRSHREGRL